MLHASANRARWRASSTEIQNSKSKIALLLLGLCLPLLGSSQVVVGSKKFTESNVLGEIAKDVLTRAGMQVEVKQNLGATIICWQALRQGSITLYPEYTGTLNNEILKHTDTRTDDQLRAELKTYGIGMSERLGFNNTYALVMLKSRASQLGITKISDLKSHPDLKCGPTLEFLGRKDGWKPMAERYGLNLANVRGIEHKLGYAALQSGEIDLKDAYSTDADIQTKNLQVLQDDLGFFPQYKAVYLYRLGADPRVPKALQTLAGKIDEPTMVRLNAEAEKTKNPASVASEFLKQKLGLTTTAPTTTSWLPELLHDTTVHLELVGISLGLAILIGLPLGIWASRPGFGGAAILSITGLIQTIPSLALFALLVPVAWLGASAKTAVLALFLYSLLPIVRNTAAGLSGISPGLRESAAALGLERGARLRKVEIPLAMPTILAGIKTAAVINVGTAVIAAFIGAGGLGQPIQTGLALSDNDLILRGGIAAAVLALLVQFAFDGIERLVVSKGLRRF